MYLHSYRYDRAYVVGLAVLCKYNWVDNVLNKQDNNIIISASQYVCWNSVPKCILVTGSDVRKGFETDHDKFITWAIDHFL